MSHLDNGVELHVVVTIKPETINLPLFGFYMDIGLMETIIYHEPIGQYSNHSVFTGETLHLAVESIRHCDDFPGDWRTAASGWLRSPP